MNRLESMSVLVAVVDAGSLSAAGRQLNMPLPTVSRKISELEAHVNARLVIRSTRKLTVTEAGRGEFGLAIALSILLLLLVYLVNLVLTWLQQRRTAQ